MAKILLIDDEEHICQLYRDELGDEGHEIASVNSGLDLLKNIDVHQPEAVVLDIRLVDYDGLELLQEIRARHHDLPVILCTAYDTYKHDPKAVAADYYVIKSFDLTPLKVAIQRVLETDASLRPANQS
ncbi:MAG TPA: response regulator [Syntrophobacteria bacterium]|jgi:DNA-binding NtrC family response regulator|nr:response regulator [Syntrophobacteria bacterium]